MDEDRQPTKAVITISGENGSMDRGPVLNYNLPISYEFPRVRIDIKNKWGNVLRSQTFTVNIVDGDIEIL